jgi:hypothetical protein
MRECTFTVTVMVWYCTKRSMQLRALCDRLFSFLNSDHSPFIHRTFLLWFHRRRLVAKRGETGREMANEFFLSAPKEVMLRTFLALKMHRTRPGLNPRILEPMRSTVTTRPPRRTTCLC